MQSLQRAELESIRVRLINFQFLIKQNFLSFPPENEILDVMIQLTCLFERIFQDVKRQNYISEGKGGR